MALPPGSGPSTRYFNLVPTGPSAPVTVLARALREELARFGPTLYLGAQEVSTLGVMHDVARQPEGHPQWLRFSSWMEEEGPRHAYVVIETDRRRGGCHAGSRGSSKPY